MSCPAARPSASRSPAALVARPEVLFADEPTGSLDSLTGEHVMDLLTATAPRRGHHRHSGHPRGRVAAYADREVMVRDGQVSYGTDGRSAA